MSFAVRAVVSGGVFIFAAGVPAVSQAQNCTFNTTGSVPGSATFSDLETSLTSLARFSGTISNALTSSLTTTNSALPSQSGAFVSNPGNPAPDSTSGGVRIRGIGGYTNVNNAGTTNADVSGAIKSTPFGASTTARNPG
jgi:hypothetical protein